MTRYPDYHDIQKASYAYTEKKGHCIEKGAELKCGERVMKHILKIRHWYCPLKKIIKCL